MVSGVESTELPSIESWLVVGTLESRVIGCGLVGADLGVLNWGVAAEPSAKLTSRSEITSMCNLPSRVRATVVAVITANPLALGAKEATTFAKEQEHAGDKKTQDWHEEVGVRLAWGRQDAAGCLSDFLGGAGGRAKN